MIALRLALVTTLLAASWPIDKITPSLARLTAGETEQCTAFSIRKRPARWVTMSHCLPTDETPILLNETIRVTKVLLQQPGDTGLAILETAVGAPPLRLGDPPRSGDTMLQIGYGGGSPRPIFYEGLVTQPMMPMEIGVMQTSSALGMPGMSGGPILDRRRRVIGVVSGAAQPTPIPVFVSFSPRYEVVAAAIKAYAR